MTTLFDNLGDIIIGIDDNNVIQTGTGDDILLGSASDDTLNGGAGNDMLLGLGGNNTLVGDAGNDTITGGAVSEISNGSSAPVLTVTADTNGMDTMTGGAGADRFVLGGNTSTQPGNESPIIHYDEAGNGDYALIQDFDSSQDTIELGGSKTSYALGTAPSGLPSGTALYHGNELIAIIQGSADLSLSASYFNGSVA